MITCYISFQKEEIVLSLNTGSEITIVEQSTGKLEKPLNIIFYNNGNIFIDNSNPYDVIKKQSLTEYNILAQDDIALSLSWYCNVKKIKEEKDLSVISQTESTYILVPISNVMNTIFNDILKTLINANINPDEFIIPISYDSSIYLLHLIRKWWSNSCFFEKKLSFIHLEPAIAMGYMKPHNEYPPVVVINYDYMNAKIVSLFYNDNCYVSDKSIIIDVTLIDLYDELIESWKKEYELVFQDNQLTRYIFYHICNTMFKTLENYSQAQVDLSIFVQDLKPIIPKKRIMDIIRDGVASVSHQIGQFLSVCPGYKVIVNGGNFRVFTIFSDLFPHMNEWIFDKHEDSTGWNTAPVIAELSDPVTKRNSSMNVRHKYFGVIKDSLLSKDLRYDSYNSQKSGECLLDVSFDSKSGEPK